MDEADWFSERGWSHSHKKCSDLLGGTDSDGERVGAMGRLIVGRMAVHKIFPPECLY